MENKTFILCDGAKRNSHGFRTNVAGIKLERFLANPVLLYQHDMERVYGRWINVRVEDNKLKADAEFDVDDPEAAKIAQKVERGFLKACSMGLCVENVVEVDGEYVAMESELFEASVVSVPSDAGAVALYDQSHKRLSIEQIKMQFNQPLNNNQMTEQEIQTLQANLAAKEQTVTELNAKVAELSQQIETLKKEKVDTYLSHAVEAGKITDAERETFAVLAAQDFDNVKKLIDAREAKKSVSLHSMMGQQPVGGEDRTNWNYLQWAKNDPAGLQKMKVENPTAFDRLVNGK